MWIRQSVVYHCKWWSCCLSRSLALHELGLLIPSTVQRNCDGIQTGVLTHHLLSVCTANVKSTSGSEPLAAATPTNISA